MVPVVSSLESEWERIRNEAKRDNTVASGRYTLGCNAALSTFMLPKVLPQLMEHFPAIEFKIALG
jgi:DNA-binding transcriptional LysR family regulator